MKNIFLIGRFNRITQDFNNCLSEKYRVQLGSDNSDIIRGMLAMNLPDLVVINLMDMDYSHEAIFRNITEQYPTLPVICVGNKDEMKHFEGVMKGAQYKKMVRPISNPELLEAVGGIFAKQKWEQREIEGKAEEFVNQEKETVEDKKPREFKKSVVEKKAAVTEKIREEDVTLDDYETLKAQIEAMIDVAMATSGKEAVHMIEKKMPDMVFLDYEMPEWNGKMTLEQIRQVPGAGKLPVVFLTGVKNKENIKAVLGLNPAGYLLKPANQEMIMDTIQKILGENK